MARRSLAGKGARLWRSTGTKNPNYSDVLYIDELIRSETINTTPDATLLERSSITATFARR